MNHEPENPPNAPTVRQAVFNYMDENADKLLKIIRFWVWKYNAIGTAENRENASWEVLSELFIIAQKKAWQIRDVDQLEGWLNKTAVRLVAARRRHLNRMDRQDDVELRDESELTHDEQLDINAFELGRIENTVEARMELEHILHTSSFLESHERTFLQTYLAFESDAERTANHLNMKAGSVRSRISRIRSKLRVLRDV